MTKLHANRFRSAELVRLIFAVTPEHGTDFDDLLKPDYWAHVAQQMRIGSVIEVRPEDGSYYAELFIRDCGRLWAKVAVLRKIDFADAAAESLEAEDPSFSVAWHGPHAKHVVFRMKPGGGKEILRDGFDTKDAASAWLSQHLMALAA